MFQVYVVVAKSYFFYKYVVLVLLPCWLMFIFPSLPRDLPQSFKTTAWPGSITAEAWSMTCLCSWTEVTEAIFQKNMIGNIGHGQMRRHWLVIHHSESDVIWEFVHVANKCQTRDLSPNAPQSLCQFASCISIKSTLRLGKQRGVINRQHKGQERRKARNSINVRKSSSAFSHKLVENHVRPGLTDVFAQNTQVAAKEGSLPPLRHRRKQQHRMHLLAFLSDLVKQLLISRNVLINKAVLKQYVEIQKHFCSHLSSLPLSLFLFCQSRSAQNISCWSSHLARSIAPWPIFLVFLFRKVRKYVMLFVFGLFGGNCHRNPAFKSS